MPKKKSAKTTRSQKPSTKVNKSAWIRSQPSTMSGPEVVAKAKAEGIKLSVAQVYTARSNAKKSRAKKASRNAGARKSGKRSPAKKRQARSAGNQDNELAFRRLVLSIGLPKAEGYLASLKHSVGL